MQQLLLTDDEAVAVALSRETPWPAPLPSVDQDDATSLRLAAMRGRRSLVVRGLANVDQEQLVLGEALSFLAERVFADATVVGVFAAQADLTLRADGWNVLVRRPDQVGDSLMHLVAPSGVHSFVTMTDEEAKEAVAQLLQLVVDGAPTDGTVMPDAAATDRLCLASSGSDSVLVVAPGSARVVDTTAGRSGEIAAGRPADVREVVEAVWVR